MITRSFKKLLSPLVLAFLLALGLWGWLLSLDLPASGEAAAAPSYLRLLSAPVTKTLSAAKDNTLYESAAGNLSSGEGETIFAGRTGQTGFFRRRGLIAFDLGEIPAGSTIISVTLSLSITDVPLGAGGSTPVNLHRLLADWGEGNSNGGGGGGAAAPGDATWIYNFYTSTTWTNAGGDFSGASSAVTQVGNTTGSYSWSSSQMVADVQGWLDTPSTNFGWLLQGDESTSKTARGYGSRENSTPANRPVLLVTYLPPLSADLALSKQVSNPAPLPGALVTYTLVVTNSGQLTATNGRISDTLPAGINFVGPVTLNPLGAGTPGNGGTLPTLASNLTITPGTNLTLTFPVSVSSGLAPGTVLTNTAAITSTEVITPVTAAISFTVDSLAYYLPVIRKEG